MSQSSGGILLSEVRVHVNEVLLKTAAEAAETRLNLQPGATNQTC